MLKQIESSFINRDTTTLNLYAEKININFGDQLQSDIQCLKNMSASDFINISSQHHKAGRARHTAECTTAD